MNYVDLLERCPLPDFADALRDEPEDLLACLGLALCLVRAARHLALSPQRIIVRIQGVQPLTAMRTLKANAIGASRTRVLVLRRRVPRRCLHLTGVAAASRVSRPRRSAVCGADQAS